MAAMNRHITFKVINFLLSNRVFIKSNFLSGRRSFLSAAYQCSDVWEQRLKGPLFGGIDLDDFFVELDRKFNTNRRVGAVDTDLFINSITDENRFEELEFLLFLFRQKRSSVRVLDSTHHAVARLCIKHGKEDLLMNWLNNRIKYGIFPDHYAMNMLMDTLLKKENYRDASRAAAWLMLQEDFSNPVGRILALYACHMHLKEENPEPWYETAPAAQEEDDDDEEEELVRIPFIRNPYFDDHFDLTLREHLLGKTLYYVGKEHKDIVGHSYMAIGLALYQKWERVLALIDSFQKTKEPILQEAVSYIQKLLASAEEVQEDTLQKLNDTLSSLEGKGLASPGDLNALVLAKMDKLPAFEKIDIQVINQLYKDWETERSRELEREMLQVTMMKKKLTLDEKKQELDDKEKVLFFFENEDKYLLELSQITKREEELSLTATKEEDYVPPEMPGPNLSEHSINIPQPKTTR